MKSILALLALSTLTPKGPKMTENDSYHARLAIEHASACASAPSVLYRPKLSADGSAWCALLGENL